MRVLLTIEITRDTQNMFHTKGLDSAEEVLAHGNSGRHCEVDTD
jgi:hypothetical protein